eukprot:gene44696-54659_t
MQNKGTPRVAGKRSASEAHLDDSDRARDSVLSDLHLAAAAGRIEDDSDDEIPMHPDTMHLTMSGGKTSVVGGRKSGSKNYNVQEHRYFLYLIDRLQAWVEGPTGEAWAEIAHRLSK